MSGSEPRVVWITGAAGGLGTNLMGVFQEAGWNVAGTTFRTPLDAGSLPRGVYTCCVDVSDPKSVKTGYTSIQNRFGRVDALIHAAGLVEDALLLKMSEKEWQRVVDVNLRGAFLCSREVIAGMQSQGGGSIIFVSSFSALCGHVGQANYAAAKAGLIGLAQSLARELGAGNIRVNVILPGLLRTAMTQALSDSNFQALALSNCLGRHNDPAEVARFVCFLAGMMNVSGQVFNLDSRISRTAT
ncbi:MAG: SDR family oxidoreductase [Verrucomicrobia bacterium]|nr:SDR family oxidoreductase [Verrucomicrobiota bacterium]